MQFLWNGSTWTTAANDSPDYPISRSIADGASVQRTWGGAARRYARWQKRTWTINWTNIGTTSVETYIRNMGSLSGTVTIASDEGTFITVPVPDSVSADTVGYSLYTCSIQLTEA